MMAFDPAAETARYIDSLGPERLAKAAAYTTGDQWITLWGVAISLLMAVIMVRTQVFEKLSARWQHWGWFRRTATIGVIFFLLSTLLDLPWTIYTGWIRERAYGLSSQPLGDFLSQHGLSALLSAVIGGLFLTGIYAFIRKLPRSWPLWGALFVGAFTTLMLLAGPALIEPMFNKYTPVPDGPVRDALVEIADRSQIPHDRIFLYDGSRQSNNFTANVSGIGSTARIAISDVALKQASLDEVKAVTAHEAGHYTLGHVWRYIVIFPFLSLILFWIIRRFYPVAARLLGSETQLGDAAGFPVFMAMVAVLSLLTVPLMNGITRKGEREADNYSLMTANKPDALATALVKTADYRDPRPSAWSEAIFHTHPSVEKRVLNAMQWKARHPPSAPLQKAP